MALSDQKNFDPNENKTPNGEAIPLTKRLPLWVGVYDKTLWDFLDLALKVAVPVILALWGFQQTASTTRIAREQEIKKQEQTQDDQHAKVMADYLEAMTKFMAEPKQKEDGGTREVIKARTLNTLSQLTNDSDQKDTLLKDSDRKGQLLNFLFGAGSNNDLRQVEDSARRELLLKDSDRKGQLLKFLFDAGLIRKCPAATDKTGSGKGALEKTCENAIFSLDGAKLSNVASDFPMQLPGVNLNRARLYGANLKAIDLSRALLESAFLTDADLTGAQFGSAQMKFVHLENAKLSDANFPNAILTNASLTGADLSGADLTGADLSGADLKNVKLGRAILKNAKLQGADLTGAFLKDVGDLSGVECDRNTKFPPNFNRTGLRMGKGCQN